jgi:hypothetical protein
MKKRCGVLCVLAVGLAAFGLLVLKSVQAQDTPLPVGVPAEGPATPPTLPPASPGVQGTPASSIPATPPGPFRTGNANGQFSEHFADIEELVKQLASVREQKEKLDQQEKTIVAEIEKKLEEKKQGLQSLQQRLEKMGIGVPLYGGAPKKPG